MAETAFQKQYRQETIAAFEVGESILREMVTTEVVIKGNTAEFLVAGSGGATAVTRGVNGLIPARGDSLTQSTATLVEWHDLVRKTGFNVFASQGNQRAIMQRTTVGVINRKIDEDILTELATGTVDTGAATTMSTALALKALGILNLAEVPNDGNIFALVSPAAWVYLMQTNAFTSGDYVDLKPMVSGDGSWKDRREARRWLGVTWMMHPNVPGVGTAAESCFMFHKSAIGHAVNTGGLMTAAGYEEEQDYSYCRASVYMGSKLLQNSGVVVIAHDGSAIVGS